MLDFGRSLGLIEAMIEELHESLKHVSVEEYEAEFDKRNLEQWLSQLDRNNAIIADFLSKTPKERLAKLLPKHKEHWKEIHVLAYLALKRSLSLLQCLENLSDGDYYRGLAASGVKLDLELRNRLKDVRLMGH